MEGDVWEHLDPTWKVGCFIFPSISLTIRNIWNVLFAGYKSKSNRQASMGKNLVFLWLRSWLCVHTSKLITFSPESPRLMATSVPSVAASTLGGVVRGGLTHPPDINSSVAFFCFLEMCCLTWLLPVALSGLLRVCLCYWRDASSFLKSPGSLSKGILWPGTSFL